MSTGEISHIGKVIAVDAEFTAVEIVSESACADCHAASLCGLDGMKVKVVEVPTRAGVMCAPGDKVLVNMKATMGHKAVWLAYVLPLVLLLGAVAVANALHAGELLCGLAGIVAVAIYYFLLYAFRAKLQDSAEFYIKSINNND